MLCAVVTSKLKGQEEIGRKVKEKVEALTGIETVLVSDRIELRVEDGLIIVPATGGTERVMAGLIEATDRPVMIWALPGNNSLPAAVEVYSVYRDRVKLVYSPISPQILEEISRFMGICRLMGRVRIGVLGGVSEWILSSGREDAERLGFEVLEFELRDDVYEYVRELVKRYELSAVTVRCFDLIARGKTACLDISRLNDEGIVAGCEGDIGAVVTMLLMSKISGNPCWMANTCRVGTTVTFAHCTVPIGMTERHELTTHAESGVGRAVKGYMRRGLVTIARYGRGKLVACLGRIIRNLNEGDLCRTQVEVEPYFDVWEFLNSVPGNHVVITYGDIRADLDYFCRLKGVEFVNLSPYRLHHVSAADQLIIGSRLKW